jgi:hypothetical protein
VTKAIRRFCIFALCTTAAPLAAQAVPPAAAPPAMEVEVLTTLGSPADDRARLAQLLDGASTAGYLLRSPSLLSPPMGTDSLGAVRFALLAPELRLTWNSAIPFSLNDGAMWAGRGVNVQLLSGVRIEGGRLSLTLAPQLIYQQNREFDFIPYSFDRSAYAYPWHTNPESLDMPSRFGRYGFHTLDAGQSTLAYDAGAVIAGASTENQWWGPGVRNALVMSNHAAGIPHLFVRTGAPVRTRIGDVEARWMVGGLAESDYFDRDRGNDRRSISALVATLQPAFEPDLTLGVARAVYGPVRNLARVPLRAFDVFRDVGRPSALPDSITTREPGPDQIFSLFGRWVLPDDGFEAYAEWSRIERPASLRDLLLAPHHTQGYTVGAQWARPLAAERSALRVQVELTYLEQSSTYQQRHVPTYYTSRPVKQGYTQRGQVIGASIGPGASSQWLAADYIEPRWQLGAFAGRIRWDNDAFYKARHQPLALGHDVSVFAGLRGGVRVRGVEVTAEYIGATRLNYLYQYRSTMFDQIDAIDVRNHTVQLMVTPALPLPW